MQWKIVPSFIAFLAVGVRRIVFVVFAMAAVGAQPTVAQPVIDYVVDAASYSANLSPGGWAAIKGKKLAQQLAQAESVPLSRTLGGVTVTVGGVAAPLHFVSPSQINVLIPFEIGVSDFRGTEVSVVVTTPEGISTPYSIHLAQKAPALFTMNATGHGSPHIYDATTWSAVPLIDTTETVVLLATGLGATNPPASSDAGGRAVPPFNEVDRSQLKVYMGETAADVLWAGLMPGYPGIYMLNVKANGALSTRVYMQQSGLQSNITDVNIPAGTNVANATGTISALIPPGFSAPQSEPISASLAFQGVTFATAFDILPGAKPFVVAAVAEGGTAILRFDPVAATYEAELMVPTAAARAGDFATAGIPLYDFRSLHGATCDVAPGNQLPLTRLDPVTFHAMQLVPLANTLGSAGIGTAYFKMTGSAPAGSRFVISAAENSILSNFAGYFQVPCAGPYATHTDTLKLFVDGKLVASRDVSYDVVHR